MENNNWNWEKLRKTFSLYYMGELSRTELIGAIGLYQRYQQFSSVPRAFNLVYDHRYNPYT